MSKGGTGKRTEIDIKKTFYLLKKSFFARFFAHRTERKKTRHGHITYQSNDVFISKGTKYCPSNYC